MKSNFVHFLPDSRLIKVDVDDSRIINKVVEEIDNDLADEVIDKELTQLLHNRDEKRKKSEQQIIEEAHKQVLNVRFEYENLKRDVIAYKAKIESIIKSQLMVMDSFEEIEKTEDKEAV